MWDEWCYHLETRLASTLVTVGGQFTNIGDGECEGEAAVHRDASGRVESKVEEVGGGRDTRHLWH